MSEELNDQIGLTLVSETDGKDKTADIIFVHGLGGGSQTTWAAEGKAENFWPAWLAQDLACATVWTLGYETSVSDWKQTSMPLFDLGGGTLEELLSVGLGTRPIIFVTHSLGGLVVKQLLNSARSQGVNRWQKFVEQTRGIAFIATPHRGSDLASFAEFARIVLRTGEQVQDLKKHSTNLRELHGAFLNIVSEQALECRSYAESEEVRPRTRVLFWNVSIPKGVIVVPKDSAEPDIPNERVITLPGDHISICKPVNRKTKNYRFVKNFVRGCLPQTGPVEGSTTLRYKNATEIDPDCIPALLKAEKARNIVYSEIVTEAFDKLEERDRRPQDWLMQHPGFQSSHELEKREDWAAETLANNNAMLRNARNIKEQNEVRLSNLLEWLRDYGSDDEECVASLRTFAAFAALRLIRCMKYGADWVNEYRQPWFEGFKFGTGNIFSRVPEISQTGRLVFGYRRWVDARVGRENQYEYVTFPLREVLPLFYGNVTGNREAFFRWVLPQLHVGLHHYPIEDFPVDTWEPFLLRGANGVEWWSSAQSCPWPEAVRASDYISRR